MSLLSLFYFERKTGLNKLQHFLGGQRQKLLRKNNCECCLSYTYSKNLMSFFFLFQASICCYQEHALLETSSTDEA